MHPDAISGEPSCARPLECSGMVVWRVPSTNLEHIPGPNYTTGALSKRGKDKPFVHMHYYAPFGCPRRRKKREREPATSTILRQEVGRNIGKINQMSLSLGWELSAGNKICAVCSGSLYTLRHYTWLLLLYSMLLSIEANLPPQGRKTGG